MKLTSYLQYLENWIKKKVNVAHAQGVVFGISGGVDSGLVAALCKRAFPQNHLALIMPCHSTPKLTEQARTLSTNLQLKTKEFDLTQMHQLLGGQLANMTSVAPRGALANANLKARLRMNVLYYFANAYNYLVVGTDNWPEWYLGYFTKYGDGAVDLVPIIHLLKRDVREAAKLLNVPTIVVDSVPTADLFPDQTDYAELQISYQQIDDYLVGKPQDMVIEQKIMDRYRITNHKRTGALIPDLPLYPKIEPK